MERAGPVEDAERGDGDERRRDGDRDGEHERLEQRRRAELPCACPACSEERGLAASLLDQEAGGEHERVAGKHGELDGEDGHAHLCHDERAARRVEGGAQLGHDGHLRCADGGSQAVLEAVELARDRLEAARRDPRRIGEDAPRDAAPAAVGNGGVRGLGDDEWPPRRVGRARRAAADIARLVPPVSIGHVARSPHAHDPRPDRPARVEPAGELDLVADGVAERFRGRGVERDRHDAARHGGRPLPGDEARVGGEVVEEGKGRELGDRRRVLAREGP